MKKLVREHINEKFKENSDPIKDMGIGRPDRKEVIVDHYFEYAVDHIVKNVYPRISDDDDKIAFNIKLRDWLDKKITSHKKYRLK